MPGSGREAGPATRAPILSRVTGARRRAGEIGAILLLGLVLLGAGVPWAGAVDGDPRGAGECLEEAAAALESEASLLEGLSAAWRRLGGSSVESAARYLAAAEVRVWEWRVRVRESVATGLIGSVPADWEDGLDGFPPLRSPGIEAGPGPLAGYWAAYRAALKRLVGLQDDLAAWTAANAMDLPATGRTCPVDGPGEFTRTWGEERPWGRAHKGEDVHAEAGTPLLAVESGTILQSGWHWQGGFGIWLAGYYSGDVYYYAHLAWIPPEVCPGATVEVGQLIGWVGSTGNATSPHLHFGWIPGSTGRWPDLAGLADPYPLLAGLCRWSTPGEGL